MSSWYAGCDYDLLVSYYKHRIQQLYSESDCQDAACSSGNCLQSLASLTFFPLHHVEKSSAINNETEAGLVGEVDRLCQILKTSVIKVLFSFIIFVIFVTYKDKGKGVSSYSKLVMTDTFLCATIISRLNNLSEFE